MYQSPLQVTEMSCVLLLVMLALGVWADQFDNVTQVNTISKRYFAAGRFFGFSSKRKSHRLRIVAIGDIHGDLSTTKLILRFADVTNNQDKWSGETDILVQTGDMIDRLGCSTMSSIR